MNMNFQLNAYHHLFSPPIPHRMGLYETFMLVCEVLSNKVKQAPCLYFYDNRSQKWIYYLSYKYLDVAWTPFFYDKRDHCDEISSENVHKGCPNWSKVWILEFHFNHMFFFVKWATRASSDNESYPTWPNCQAQVGAPNTVFGRIMVDLGHPNVHVHLHQGPL